MVLKNFDNETILKIGLKLIELAKRDQKRIGILVQRGGLNIFSYLMTGMSNDKKKWLERKAKSVVHFQMSTKDLHKKMKGDDRLLLSKYGLDKTYTSVAGGLPVFINKAGMVGCIAVTGLTPDEDHQIILDAIEELESGDNEL